MILILASYGDETTRAVYEALGGREDAPELLFLTDVELVSGLGWSQRQADSVTATTLRLSDGRSAATDKLTAVFNRISYLHPQYFPAFSETDRLYAAGEMFALLLSWLASLRCPVVNPVGVRDLSGGSRSLLAWLQLAGRAGLPVRQAVFTTNARLVAPQPYMAYVPANGAALSQTAHFTPVAPGLAGQNPALLLSKVTAETRRMLIIGDEAQGDLPDMAEGCLRLAQLSKTVVLECLFARAEDSSWLLSAVNPLPRLDAMEAASVADLLINKQGGRQ